MQVKIMRTINNDCGDTTMVNFKSPHNAHNHGLWLSQVS